MPIAKRTIPIKDFVTDIRTGKTNDQLMEKYQIDAFGLRNTLDKMLQVKALRPDEVSDRMPSDSELPASPDRRQLPRRYVLFSFPVYLADDLSAEGLVNDITEKGLQLSGITAGVGETLSLLIRADEFADIYPFVFDATCRWCRHASESANPVAGFEITNISEVGLEELRKLIQVLAFE
jgi:hypothetical protein